MGIAILKRSFSSLMLPMIFSFSSVFSIEGSTIHSDGWKAYDGLILNDYDHYRVFHGENEFAREKCHVNGIENVQTLFA